MRTSTPIGAATVSVSRVMVGTMHDLAWTTIGRLCASVGLCLSLGACSDDGFIPEAGDGEGTAGGSTGQAQASTGSVNTSATVTATGSGDGEDSGEPPSDTGDPVGTTGDPGTGDDVGDTTGASETTDDGTSSGGPQPDCVATDDCACDPDEVFCEALPPACPPGMVPEIDPAAMCWTFACVPAESCETVMDCTVCGMDQACIAVAEPTGPVFICEPIPPACMGVPTCECMPGACPMPFECVGPPPKSAADLGCL